MRAPVPFNRFPATHFTVLRKPESSGSLTLPTNPFCTWGVSYPIDFRMLGKVRTHAGLTRIG